MLWKLMTLAGLVVFVNGKAHHLQYPLTGTACILADIDMNNTLTRTDGNKTDTVPTYSLDKTNITSGDCRKTRILNLKYPEDGATIQFTFKNNSGTVNMQLTFSFLPSNIWTGGSNSSVTMVSSSMAVGHREKSYMCHSSQLIKFKKVVDTVTYEAVWNMFDSQIQAFDVENNTYSEAEECSQDMTTVAPHTTANETTATTPSNATTHSSNATTHSTNATTETTTVPSNMTTEPTNATTETTQPPAPTTPKPDLHPKNTYTFNASDHHSKCVRLQAEIEFTIPYPNQAKSVKVGIPKDVTVSGECNYTDSTGQMMNMIKIEFRDNWSFELVFSNSKVPKMLGADKDNSFWWHEATLNYVYEKALFPNITASYVDKKNVSTANFTNSQFSADMDGSYICSAKTTTNLGQGVTMETWNLQYFAFENKTDFSDNKISQCSGDSKTNSVVPIAVGAALAGLVVIVLIAYLIGRRRNRKGYESV